LVGTKDDRRTPRAARHVDLRRPKLLEQAQDVVVGCRVEMVLTAASSNLQLPAITKPSG